MLSTAAVSALLQIGSLPSGPLGQLLTVLVAVGVVVLIGRVALRIAWRLITVAAIIVGLALLVTMLVPGFGP